MSSNPAPLTLTGFDLTVEDLVRVARQPGVRVHVDQAAMGRVAVCRKMIDEAVVKYKAAYPNVKRDDLVYGVTSGFGEFKKIAIDPNDLIKLQENILLSHATGLGDTAEWRESSNYFSAEVIRAVLIIRLNTFLRGNSGVRPELVLTLEAMINAGITPLVPTKGSVGSSGDLCPLSHLFVTLLGEGHFYVNGADKQSLSTPTPNTWMIEGRWIEVYPAKDLWSHLMQGALSSEAKKAVDVVKAQPVSNKEGLALTNGATFSAALLALSTTNGATFSAALLALSTYDAEVLANTGDVALALTMESLCARVRFLDEKVHHARGMKGQMASAANVRQLVDQSRLCEWTEDVQDSYSIRCSPQVHGATRDAIAYAKMVVGAEINATTDNPLFFPGHEPFGVHMRKSRPEQNQRIGDISALSAGNFHGQPIGLAADFLAIAVAELANISERRTQMLLDSDHNRNLPPNLIAIPGVNSGFMISQYAAAALVSENKVLAHPASVDSIPTSANFEDHVAMATHAARKARQVLENVRAVLAIELMVAAQAVEWRTCLLDDEEQAADVNSYYAINPNQKAKAEVVGTGDAAPIQARAHHREEVFSKIMGKGPSDRTLKSLGVGSGAAYKAIRSVVQPMVRDEVIEPMIRALRILIHKGEILETVNQVLTQQSGKTLSSIPPL